MNDDGDRAVGAHEISAAGRQIRGDLAPNDHAAELDGRALARQHVVDDRLQREALPDDLESPAGDALVVEDLEGGEDHAVHGALDLQRRPSLGLRQRPMQPAEQGLGMPERCAERLLQVTTDGGDELGVLTQPSGATELAAEPTGGDLQDLRFFAGVLGGRPQARRQNPDALLRLEEYAVGDPRSPLAYRPAIAH